MIPAMTRLRPASNSNSGNSISMSETENANEQAYRIATNVSSGKVKDPVTGDVHGIEPTSDVSGEIRVSNPYSAVTLVKESNGFEFVDDKPTDHEVTQAQKSALGVETIPDHVLSFAESKAGTLGDLTLDADTGFDPETGDAYNDKRLKAVKMYDRLQSEGYTDEARFLRLLGNLTYQEDFADYVRESDEVDV